MLHARKLFIRFKNVFAKNGFQSSFYNPQSTHQGFYTRTGNKTLVKSKGKNSLPLIVIIQQCKLSR